MIHAEQVKADNPILDVVLEQVELRRHGAEWGGLCPFHSERTPSFKVNPKKGVFKCWGCGVAGDVITFVDRLHGGIGFRRSMALLAKRAGLSDDDAGRADIPMLKLADAESRAFDRWLWLWRRRLEYRRESLGIHRDAVMHFAEACAFAGDPPPDEHDAHVIARQRELVHRNLNFVHTATAEIDDRLARMDTDPSEFVGLFLGEFYGNKSVREVVA